MSYSFDLSAAINAIAAIEDAIASPTPGIVKSYTYGANPVEFTAGSQLPAIVHIPTGPVVEPASEYATQVFAFYYEIISRLLIVEAVQDQYPADEGGAALFWKTIIEALLTDTTRRTLCSASGAFSYSVVFQSRSYGIRPWPPIENAPSRFWSLEYTHRFTIQGG